MNKPNQEVRQKLPDEDYDGDLGGSIGGALMLISFGAMIYFLYTISGQLAIIIELLSKR